MTPANYLNKVNKSENSPYLGSGIPEERRKFEDASSLILGAVHSPCPVAPGPPSIETYADFYFAIDIPGIAYQNLPFLG